MAGVSGQQALAIASQFLGQPYVWGGQAPGGFDCSGLMWYVYQQLGINIPRTSNAQISALQSVAPGQVQVGDLVFFDSDNNGMSDHVGMYAGNGMVLVADNPSQPIHVVSLSTEARITGVGRAPGVINTGGGDNIGSFSSLTSALGLHFGAVIPAARPTFDLWGNLGLQAPNSASMNENYGLSAAFLESDPELADLYSRAVAGSWSTDMFQSQLQGTQWWLQNSDTARKLLAEKSTDPAKYQQDLAAKVALVQEQATRLGASLSSQGLQNIASVSLMLNYNDEQINGMLSKYVTLSQGGHFGGYAGQVELGLRTYAQDMGIPITDASVQSAVQGVVAGTDSLQTHRAMIQTQAELAFPAYADQIKSGVTVGQIAAPFLQAQSKILEIDPNKIDLFDPMLRGALTKTGTDPSNKAAFGQPVQQPLYDYELTLRQDPRWLKTNNAREGVMGAANAVLSDMGLMSTPGGLGAAPQTSAAQTQNSRADFGGLSGMTKFPTLQGKSIGLNPGPLPTGAGATAAASVHATESVPNAASLAPDNSFKVTNF